MQKLAAACLFASFLAVPQASSLPAYAADAAEAACAAARDGRLGTLENEAASVAVAFDTDIAVAESPEYQLLKDMETLLREIEAEKEAARERYRRCAAGAAPR